MKVSLGCCYQCDVPPDNIQNLRIFYCHLLGRTVIKSRLYLHIVKSVQLQLEKFFCFFFGWAHPVGRQVSSGWARPIASSLQAVKKIIFIFILHLGSCRIYIQLVLSSLIS